MSVSKFVKASLLISAFAVVFCTSIVACQSKSSSKVNFSTAHPDNTLIKATLINSVFRLPSDAAIKACLLVYSDTDAPAEFITKTKETMKKNILAAMDKWQRLLAMNPKWPHRKPLPVHVEECALKGTAGSEELPQDKHFIVGAYPSETKWLEVGCNGSLDCRSHASFIGARADMNTFDLEEVLLAHEIGHLFGLNDIYKETDEISFTLPQPTSVMSESILDEEAIHALTEDDKSGLTLLLDAMILGNWDQSNPICPEGYKVDREAKSRNFGGVFCSPKDLKKASTPLIKFK